MFIKIAARKQKLNSIVSLAKKILILYEQRLKDIQSDLDGKGVPFPYKTAMLLA